MTSHYDTLGVDPKASAAEIKKARRKLASKSHPDRGGDDDKMAEINRAYEVLIDPRRRQTYDASGDDGGRPIDEQAHEMLSTMFAAALEKEARNLIIAVRQMLEMHRGECQRLLHRDRSKVVKFITRRDKIKSKTKVNLVHVLIDTAVKDLDAAIENNEEQLKVNAAAAKMLDGYTSDEAVEIVMPTRRTGMSSFFDLGT